MKGQTKMKKFLAIVFSLIFALSACTVAFAANFECEVCHAVFADQKSLDSHNNGGCLVVFKDCKYCAAKVEESDLAAHEAECPKGASTCDKCGAALANETEADTHACDPKDVASSVLDKAIDALKEVDWKSLADKVVGAVKGIDFEGLIAKIKPLVEKVVTLVKGFAA